MIAGKRVLGLIPARAGSKGVPGKNIKLLANKPLICWTIEEALKSIYLDRLVISTDSVEIAEIASKNGCDVPFLRPSSLAQDDTPGVAPVLHALTELPGYDLVVLLQPTSPLRRACDVDQALELCIHKQAKTLISIVEPSSSPYHLYRCQGGKLNPLMSDASKYTRRQDMPQFYSANGAIYIACASELLKTKKMIDEGTYGYIMPQEYSIDIDNEFDFRVAELLLIDRACGVF